MVLCIGVVHYFYRTISLIKFAGNTTGSTLYCIYISFCSVVVTIPALFLWSIVLKSLRLPSLRFFMVFFSFSTQMLR